MSGRLARTVVVLAVVLSAAAAVGAGVLAAGEDVRVREVGVAIAAVAWSACGALLVRARPRNWLGWILLLVGVTSTLGPFAATLGRHLEARAPGSDIGLVIAWLGSFYWPVSVLVPVTVLLVLYPTGRPPSPRWRPLLAASVAGIALMCVVLATSSASFDDVVPGARLPFTVPRWAGLTAGVLLLVLLIPSVLVSLIGTALRLRRAGQPERQQLSWLVLPVTAFVTFAFVNLFGDWTVVLAFAAVPVAVVVGVLRYNLLGIEVLVRRTLVYLLLTAAVALVFALVTTALSRLLPSGPVPSFVAAALVAVGLVPARDLLQRTVDHAIYGQRRDPIAVMARLGRQVVDQPGTDLVPAMLSALADALRVPSIRVTDLAGRTVVEYGVAPAEGADAAVPLRYAAGEIGRLIVVTRRSDALGGRDLQLLTAVAPLAAAVLRAAALTVDLDDARRRTVAVALAERDRLRRDLHDGLGPSLTGMSLGLEAVQDLLPDNPSAEDVMIRLREEMGATIGELRRILAGLQPGVLEERGLAEALRHRAKTAAHAGGLAVAVAVPESLPPLAGELEVAAYRIADEALTNIVRHAQAKHASITVTITDAVRLEICDDGRGPPSTPTNGVGLGSMRRRTEELGGQFLLEASQTGGTRLVATLPRGT